MTKKEREIAEKLLACLPTTWLDPLLTGDKAVLSIARRGSWNCDDIERLVTAIKHRMEKELGI